jgi:hypothetical protein
MNKCAEDFGSNGHGHIEKGTITDEKKKEKP